MHKPKSRTTVRDTPLQQLGMFAVMRHNTKFANARFASLHETYESAAGEAARLVADSISRSPDLSAAFYVMEVAARFSGGPEGFACIERKV